MKQKTTHYLKNVLFTDENKFNIFDSDERVLGWRKPKEEFRKQNLLPTAKYGGGGDMPYFGVRNIEFIDGIIDQYNYNYILNRNLPLLTQKLSIQNDFKFYQDNNPKHTARNLGIWLVCNCPRIN